MNLGSISDQLPSYPNSIQGELRVILQTKDVFLVCYKHLEEYRRLVNEQNRLITKEFVQEQLQIGEDEISELKMELQDAESRLGARLRHNELLADHLASLGFASLESGASVRHLALCRSPQTRKNMLAQRGGGDVSKICEPRPPTHMIDNIALAIAEIHQEVRSKVKPLLDYYRDLFYLQLHFSLVLGQVCNYCMPLVTENIGLIDRIFFWSERPEFDLVRRAGDIGDRLKEIYTRAQTVLSVLGESVRFLQSKVELQKTLEQRFHERLDEQQKTKDRILREVHTTKQNMDMLEEENDRLVGSLVKVDPSFVDSRHFYELAEGGNLMGAKKPPSTKETAQNNAEDITNNGSPSGRTRETSDELEHERGVSGNVRLVSRRTADASSPSFIENASDEVNNNKALSVLSDPPSNAQPKREISKPIVQPGETESPLVVSKTKSTPKSKKTGGQKTSNLNNTVDEVRQNELNLDNVAPTPKRQTHSDTTTPVPKKTSHECSRARSKSRKRELSYERFKSPTPGRDKPKVRRRGTSIERDEKQIKLKKNRSKSTLGERRVKEVERHVRKREGRSTTPVNKNEEINPSSMSIASGDSTDQPVMPPVSLKAKLLGRTKDLLEAALRRSPRNGSTEQVSKTFEGLDSSSASGRVEPQEINNDGVTSVSSFASLLVTDSPIGDPTFVAPANRTSAKQLRTLEPRKSKDLQAETRRSKKDRHGKRGRSQILQVDGQQPLPSLSSETLLTDISAGDKYSPIAQFPNYAMVNPTNTKHTKGRRGSRQLDNNLSDFLAGTSIEPLQTVPSPPSRLPSIL